MGGLNLRARRHIVFTSSSHFAKSMTLCESPYALFFAPRSPFAGTRARRGGEHLAFSAAAALRALRA